MNRKFMSRQRCSQTVMVLGLTLVTGCDLHEGDEVLEFRAAGLNRPAEADEAESSGESGEMEETEETEGLPLESVEPVKPACLPPGYELLLIDILWGDDEGALDELPTDDGPPPPTDDGPTRPPPPTDDGPTRPPPPCPPAPPR